MHTNSFAISGLLAGFSSIVFGLFVYSREPRRKLYRLWLLFTVTVSVWGFGVFAIGLAPSSGLALIFWRATYIGVIFIPAIFYHFVIIFLGLRRRIGLILVYVVSSIFLIADATPLLLRGTTWMFDQFYFLYPVGIVYPYFVLFFFIMVFVSHFDLLTSMRKTNDSGLRAQIGWFLGATTVGFSGGALVFLPSFGIRIYPYGNFAIFFYPIIMSYAILKHQLMDIKVVIEKTLAYLFFFAMISIFYFLIVFVVYNLVTNNFISSVGISSQCSSLYVIPPLLGGLFTFGLGLFVYLKNKNSTSHQLFSLLSFVMFIWLISYSAAYSTTQISTAVLLSRIACLSASFTAVFSYHFCVAFFNLKKEMAGVRIAYFFTAILFLGFAFTNLLLSGVYHYFWGYYSKAGPLHPLYLFVFFVIWARSFYLLFRVKFSRDFDCAMKNQAKYFIVGFAAALLASIDYLPKYGFEIYPFGFIFVMLFVVVVAYAIIKHSLLDIRVIVRRTIVYSLLIVAVSAIYVISIFVLYKMMVKSSYEPTQHIFKGLILVFVIALLLKPLEFFLHRFLDKKFFKGSIREISEQKSLLETELERGERLKSVGILAAGMAHEIKNPITAIRTFAEYLPKKYDDPEFREKFSRLLVQETDRISSIVVDLLLFAKPGEPVIQPCDAGEVLNNVTDLIRADLIKHSIDLTLKLDSSARCLADPLQIKQAFLNIIMNAVDSMKSKSGPKQLTISLNRIDNQIQICVEDTGLGIIADKISHLFDPFYTDKESGTGLGLAVTHSIVEKNHGKIEVDSRVGVGTVFRIYLPRVSE